MKVHLNKSIVKSIMLSFLIVFSIEFTIQRLILEFIRENSYEEINKCLLGDAYNDKNLIENKTLPLKNIEKDDPHIYDKLINVMRKKESVNECLVNYVHKRDETLQKNISSYLYAILILILILSFSPIITFIRRNISTKSKE